jgi:hypothetical protein
MRQQCSFDALECPQSGRFHGFLGQTDRASGTFKFPDRGFDLGDTFDSELAYLRNITASATGS